MGRGFHFAIDETAARKLIDASVDEEKFQRIVEEETDPLWDKNFAFDSDKGWDALHRTFSNGTFDIKEEDPLTLCFLGGRPLLEEGEFVALLAPEQVAAVAMSLAGVSETWLRSRYFSMEFSGYKQGQDEEDFAYSWACFQGLPEFFARAAAAARYVMFMTAS